MSATTPESENRKRPAETQCSHWLKRKKRFCKMSAAKDRTYCAEHEPISPNQTTEAANDNERIVCPLDKKHTVFKKKLQKHLKICNARPKEDEPPYIQKDINAGDGLAETEDYSKLKITELKDDEFYGVIEKIKTLNEKYLSSQIDTLEVQHKSLEIELAKSDYGKESRKHIQQTAALLGVLESENQLQDFTSFIEFGAGKGQLAYYLARLLEQLENSQVVLLDRMSLRHKKDNKIENKSLVHRIRADIADFRMCHLDLLKSTKRNVAFSKHLCGAATDLTLRCITQPTDKVTPVSPTEFILIALCCHHRCDWRSFVGKQFFQSEGISLREFVIITKMVGWAICGTGMSRERRQALKEQSEKQSVTPQESVNVNALQRLSLAEREEIGFMCKRVLDYARLVYLREHGYDASLKNYVPRDVTLENVCLLAKKL